MAPTAPTSLPRVAPSPPSHPQPPPPSRPAPPSPPPRIGHFPEASHKHHHPWPHAAPPAPGFSKFQPESLGRYFLRTAVQQGGNGKDFFDGGFKGLITRWANAFG